MYLMYTSWLKVHLLSQSIYIKYTYHFTKFLNAINWALGGSWKLYPIAHIGQAQSCMWWLHVCAALVKREASWDIEPTCPLYPSIHTPQTHWNWDLTQLCTLPILVLMFCGKGCRPCSLQENYLKFVRICDSVKCSRHPQHPVGSQDISWSYNYFHAPAAYIIIWASMATNHITYLAHAVTIFTEFASCIVSLWLHHILPYEAIDTVLKIRWSFVLYRPQWLIRHCFQWRPPNWPNQFHVALKWWRRLTMFPLPRSHPGSPGPPCCNKCKWRGDVVCAMSSVIYFQCWIVFFWHARSSVKVDVGYNLTQIMTTQDLKMFLFTTGHEASQQHLTSRRPPV